MAATVPAITYQILYKDNSNNILSISFADFSFNLTNTNTDKTFKAGLKSLLETKDVKLFIGELLFVAEKNKVQDLSGSQLPFIFAIDTINGDRSQRTYLTFSGDSNIPKVNFFQYSVETALKPDVDKVFGELINDAYKYTYYTSLVSVTPPLAGPLLFKEISDEAL